MDRRKLYYFRMTDEPRFSGLAIDCQLQSFGSESFLEFHDTLRGHMIDGHLVSEAGDTFVFRSTGHRPGDWTFKVVTISIFRRWLYKNVEAGAAIAQKIHTTEDLHEWYRKRYEQTF